MNGKKKEERRVPKLRFPGFTEDWEQRKLGNNAEFSKGNGYSKSDLESFGKPLVLYGRLYTNYEFIISEVDTFAELKKGSIISEGNEVLVPASGETAEEIARASYLAKQGVIIGGDLNIIKPRGVILPSFLALILSNGSCQKELSKKAQGKSVVHLRNSDIMNVIIKYPEVGEQKKIIEVFTKIENLITLHQRKLEDLKEMKKGLLQKMFPKNNEKVPELRFPGFTEDWEQRKLNEICDYTSSSLTASSSIENGKYILYDANTEIGSVDSFSMAEDYITVIKDGAGVGRIRKLPKNTAFIGTMGALTSKNKKTDFLYYLLEKKDLSKQFTGSTIPHIYFRDYGKDAVCIPKDKEQQVIGVYFKQFDNLITLHQRKLDHLKELKKGLLQQMFV